MCRRWPVVFFRLDLAAGYQVVASDFSTSESDISVVIGPETQIASKKHRRLVVNNVNPNTSLPESRHGRYCRGATLGFATLTPTHRINGLHRVSLREEYAQGKHKGNSVARPEPHCCVWRSGALSFFLGPKAVDVPLQPVPHG
jgi:hypothetical protein